ncbi:MAG: 7-cyano-7-deazaguanine synthase [Ignavibacteriales bacterium]|nr:7-cyano-7-deazaguanine synthase [Ignavibacteriales bacterium]
MKKKVTVLFSGGIDSTACLHYYLSHNYSVLGLFVDFGQKSAKKEFDAVKNISKYFKIEFNSIQFSEYPYETSGKINGRNLLLLSAALFYSKYTSGIIALGIHSGTSYPDCDQSFIDSVQHTFDIYMDGKVQIECPFINFEKKEIYKYCIDSNIPLELTYSCEMGAKQPCGQCLSCKDLIALYEIKNP